MKCQKCRNDINVEVCPYCGYKNDLSYLKYLNDDAVKVNIEAFKNNEIIDDNKYLNSFIGNDVEYFKDGGLSFPYFFFGEYYLLYRKMYSLFFIRFIVNIVLIFIVIYAYSKANIGMMLICLVIVLLIQIVSMFFVRKYYYNYALRNVHSILEENKGKSEEEITAICRKKGGTNLILPVVLFIIVSLSNTIRSTNIGSSSVKVYGVKIRDLNILGSSYLGFNETNYYENYSFMIENECSVVIKTDYDNDDLEEFVTDYDADYNDLESTSINGWDWYYYSGQGKKYYFTVKDGFNYMVLIGLNNSRICDSSVKLLVSSLEFGEDDA